MAFLRKSRLCIWIGIDFELDSFRHDMDQKTTYGKTDLLLACSAGPNHCPTTFLPEVKS